MFSLPYASTHCGFAVSGVRTIFPPSSFTGPDMGCAVNRDQRGDLTILWKRSRPVSYLSTQILWSRSEITLLGNLWPRAGPGPENLYALIAYRVRMSQHTYIHNTCIHMHRCTCMTYQYFFYHCGGTEGMENKQKWGKKKDFLVPSPKKKTARAGWMAQTPRADRLYCTEIQSRLRGPISS